MSNLEFPNLGTQLEMKQEYTLKRSITWIGAFWVASGVPALVLFSIGGLAAIVGAPSWLCWAISVTMGLFQSLTYAEIAGLFPNKSGGASVYGAIAWVRYSKFIAPLSTWCNWFAWTPILSIGTGLAAGYILNALFQQDSIILTWQITLVDLGWIMNGLTLRINSTFIIAAAILLIIFTAQHFGIARAAKAQMIMAIATLTPLTLIGVVPILTGDVLKKNFTPFVPLSGAWNLDGWHIFLGGMFIAAWSTYAFETVVCYTREFQNPKKDTIKAIISSGLLAMFFFIIVPFTFQGVFGVEYMTDPTIVDGTGVAKALGSMVGGGSYMTGLIIMMLLLALILSIMTSMAGSSRTLYQASVDGWLPKYLSKVNKHGAPTNAMWTDLIFNLILLLMSNYMFIIAASNVGYIIFNFLNLNSGWIHRIDNPHVERPWRAPTFIIGFNVVLGFLNLVFMGAGASVVSKGALFTGLIWASLIIPVFSFRHFITDKGKFPEKMYEDLQMQHGQAIVNRAGVLPYVTLFAGVAVVAVSYLIFS